VTALKLRDKALAYASELLQTATGELDIVDGVVVTRGTSIGPSISLADIAGRVTPGSRVLGDREPGLTAEGWYNTHRLAFSYGVHVALVRIDRETGGVAIERYVVAHLAPAGRDQRAHLEHRGLLDAWLARDEAAIVAKLSEHIAATLEDLRLQFAASAAP
jgi:hypothetical protein